jgi:hypothetical protein
MASDGILFNVQLTELANVEQLLKCVDGHVELEKAERNALRTVMRWQRAWQVAVQIEQHQAEALQQLACVLQDSDDAKLVELASAVIGMADDAVLETSGKHQQRLELRTQTEKIAELEYRLAIARKIKDQIQHELSA